MQRAGTEGSSPGAKAAAGSSVTETKGAAEWGSPGKWGVLSPPSPLESPACCPGQPELFGEGGVKMPFFHCSLCRSSVSTTQIYLDSRREEIRGISSGEKPRWHVPKWKELEPHSLEDRLRDELLVIISVQATFL